MTPDISFHGVHSIKAHSSSNPSGTTHWLVITFGGEDKEADQIEITLFIDAPAPRLLAGLIAKAINEAVTAHEGRE